MTDASMTEPRLKGGAEDPTCSCESSHSPPPAFDGGLEALRQLLIQECAKAAAAAEASTAASGVDTTGNGESRATARTAAVEDLDGGFVLACDVSDDDMDSIDAVRRLPE